MTTKSPRDLWKLEDYDSLYARFDTHSAVMRYLVFEKKYGEQEVATFLGKRRQHVNNVCREASVENTFDKKLAEYRKGKQSSKK